MRIRKMLFLLPGYVRRPGKAELICIVVACRHPILGPDRTKSGGGLTIIAPEPPRHKHCLDMFPSRSCYLSQRAIRESFSAPSELIRPMAAQRLVRHSR